MGDAFPFILIPQLCSSVITDPIRGSSADALLRKLVNSLHSSLENALRRLLNLLPVTGTVLAASG